MDVTFKSRKKNEVKIDENESDYSDGRTTCLIMTDTTADDVADATDIIQLLY